MKEKKTANTFLLRSSAGIFLSRFVITMSLLVIFALFSHKLPLHSNGEYLRFYVRFSLLSLIAGAGITMLIFNYSAATVKWLWKSVGVKHKIRYLIFILIMSVILNVVHFASPENYATPVYVFALSVYFIANIGTLFTDAILIVSRKIRELTIINFAYSICFLAIHLSVLYTGFFLESIISWLAVLASVKFITGLRIAHSTFSKIDIQDATPVHFRRIRLFWYALLTFDMSQIAFRQIDKFVITFIAGTSVSAIYINGTLEIPFLALLSASVSNAALLQLNSSKERTKGTITGTVRQVANIMGTVTLAVFFFFFIYREMFIVFFFSEKYLASVPIFAISLFKLLTYLFTITFLLKFKHRGKMLNIGALMDIVVSLLLIYPLYVLMELKGIILSFVIGSIAQALYVGYAAAKTVRVKMSKLFPLRSWIVKAVVFGSVLYLVSLATKILDNAFVELCIGGAVSVGLTVMWLYKESYQIKGKIL